ncbi:MAG: hypothetical protein M9916_06730 [Crocinitomicaceae bacterium]|nr:hypothetical protein [Crocinitomicaceae bacterium]
MRKVTVLMIGLVIIAVAGLTSCNKEKQINKNLWKGDGIWNIDTRDEQTTSTYFQEDNYTEYKKNAGTIEFKKDGTGTYKDAEYSYPITYTNTDKSLTMSFIDEDGNVSESEILNFDVEWKKNQLELKSYTVTTYNTGNGSGGTVNVTYTHRLNLSLSKKK